MRGEADRDSAWEENVERDARGSPCVSPRFALERGADVQLVDLRDVAHAAGPLGFVSGSAFPDPAALDEAARDDAQRPLVLVSADGEEAAALARRLEAAGARRVAALAGGLAGWRALGFLTTRDVTRLSRTLAPPPERAPSGEAVTLEHLRLHLADPRSVHWIQLASLLFHASASCVDGRDARGVFGTPGGDAGEVALVLAAAEQVTGETLAEETVEAALLAHLDAFGDFYLHTDTDALGCLRGELRADPRAGAAAPQGAGAEEWREYLRAPSKAVRDALLDHLATPSHVGCGHLRLQLEHGPHLGVRPELVAAVLRSSYRLMWAGSPEVRPVILEGGHAESAVLSIALDHELHEVTPVPIVSPHHEGRQMFVNHGDAAARLRRTVVRYHASAASPLPLGRAQVEAACAAADELAARLLERTLDELAKGLPVFRATFAEDGSVSVEPAGHVGQPATT